MANQKPSEHPSDDLQDDIFVSTNHILRTDHPSDGFSYRPITSFGRIILRTDFRLDQSHPSAGSSFGRTFVSTNHILRLDHLSDGLLSRPIRNPQDNQVTRMVTDHTSDETHKSQLSTTRHSNDLGSHERDGQKRRKKSPRAKVVRICTH